MSMHDIHSCTQIFSQNVELRQKLQYIKRKKDEVQKQLNDLLEEQGKGSSAVSRKSTRNIAVQTDPKPWMFRYSSPPAKPQEKIVTESDIAKTNKVLEMHSQLLKRYDKEVKLNMNYADEISDLNVRLADTERKLREEKEKTVQLEREVILARGKKGKSDAEDPVLRDVVKERNKLAKENSKLKGELKGLDQNFFDEIEDLKYALLQSAKLNSEYEKCLRKICSQQGVPYPMPEKILHKSKK